MKHTISACHFLKLLECSLAKAQEALDQEFQNHIQTYFQEDGTPKMFQIQTPSGTLPVPQLCLAGQSPLSLKTVHLNFDCCIEGIQKGELMLNLSKQDSKLPLHIDIVLQSEEPPESVMRINDQLISEYLP